MYREMYMADEPAKTLKNRSGPTYVVGQLISFYDFDQNQQRLKSKNKPLEMLVEVQDLSKFNDSGSRGSNTSTKYEKVLVFEQDEQFVLVQLLANNGSEYEEDQYIVFFTCLYKQIIMTETESHMGTIRVILHYCIEPNLSDDNIVP